MKNKITKLLEGNGMDMNTAEQTAEEILRLFNVSGQLPTLQDVWDRFPKGSDVDKRVGANWVIQKVGNFR